jgi:hypothetical protein
VRADIFTAQSSPTSLQIQIPKGATSGLISVINSASDGSGGTGIVMEDFTVTTPTITKFSPNNGPVGTVVSIKGANLANTASVQFIGNNTAVPGQIVSTSNNQVKVIVPSGAPSPSQLLITLTDGSITDLSTGFFTLAANSNAPVINSLSPTFGATGASITISGSGFTNASSVKVNGANAVFTVMSDTSINLTVPASASTGTISVTTANGSTASADTFTFVPSSAAQAESIDEIILSDNANPTLLTMSIIGSNFTTNTQVLINGMMTSIDSYDTDDQGRQVINVSIMNQAQELDVEVEGFGGPIAPLAAKINKLRVTVNVEVAPTIAQPRKKNSLQQIRK